MYGQVEATPRIDSFTLDRGPPVGVETARKANGFGGFQTFFLCPGCGQRARYLYYTGSGFLCRKCARLNYRCQQESKRDPVYYYRKGMAYAEKHLRPEFYPLFRFEFAQWLPPCPRYMHEPAYQRHLVRLRRYQKKYEARQLENIRRAVESILGSDVWEKIYFDSR